MLKKYLQNLESLLNNLTSKGPCPLRGGFRPTLTKSYNLYTIL
jgi:hypothetical protein